MMVPRFDDAYYQRFYPEGPEREEEQAEVSRKFAFTMAFFTFWDIPFRGMLDLGCGVGFWQTALRRWEGGAQIPFVSVEQSEYLCARFGWTKGNIVDFTWPHPFDLVICNDVLRYLNSGDCHRAVENLAVLCTNVLYFDVLTLRELYEVVDPPTGDVSGFLREGDYYRMLLGRHFIWCGGNLFVHRKRTTDYNFGDMEAWVR